MARALSVNRVAIANPRNFAEVIAMALQPEKARGYPRSGVPTSVVRDPPMIGPQTGTTGATVRKMADEMTGGRFVFVLTS